MLILCDEITPCLAYTAKVLFDGICQTSYKLVESKDFTAAEDNFLVNYRKEILDGALNIEPAGLIESGKRMKEIPTGIHQEENILFPSGTSWGF